MPNIAQVLKQEITRVARKELRGESQSAKQAHTHNRLEISKLKKRVADLERLVAQLARNSTKKAPPPEEESSEKTFRFSAQRLAAHRQRLDISVADMAFLLNASTVSIYKWENGKARPRASYMPAIAALRTLSKAQAATVLASRR